MWYPGGIVECDHFYTCREQYSNIGKELISSHAHPNSVHEKFLFYNCNL